MKAIFLVLVPFSLIQSELLGKWQLVSFEAFSNIISSPRHFEASDEERIRVENTFQMVLDNTYYHFDMDTVFFSDYKENQMIEKMGRWHVTSDTLYINDLSKIKTYKFFIKEVNSDSLVMNLIHGNGDVGKNDMVFVRNKKTEDRNGLVVEMQKNKLQ
ncbi:lipocalin family protein [Litoribacter populi]|uniref:lipocalin family protein n=1 Tax=Litoribacter populi TaxID=2598460 RepID=UPI0011808816|nr:lipocalin family protein [Litoribacter populi]